MIGVASFSAQLGGRMGRHAVPWGGGGGECGAVCGRTGAGKTTLLRGLAGLLPGGTARPRHVAYVEQGARSAWGLTVAQVAALGRIPWGGSDAGAAMEAMQACGVAGLADRRVDRLSGGQARRAMLARALATRAPVLLLDEPAADLDPAAAHEIMRLLAGLARSGRVVVAVLHAVELAAAYATRMVVLEDGRIVADAAPGEALARAASCFGMDLRVDGSARLAPRDLEGM